MNPNLAQVNSVLLWCLGPLRILPPYHDRSGGASFLMSDTFGFWSLEKCRQGLSLDHCVEKEKASGFGC